MSAALPWGALEWEKDPPAVDWDHALAALSGHPLQSCLWGDARRQVDVITQHRWLARRNDEPIWMIRVEERMVLGTKIAWAPRGPTGRTADLTLSLAPGFEGRLRTEGFSLLITDPWVAVTDGSTTPSGSAGRSKGQTIWIDLSLGKDLLFSNLHKHVRNAVRRAAKIGVAVGTTVDPNLIGEFVDLCRGISARKGFELRVTLDFLNALLHDSKSREDAETALFVSLKDGRLGAGLLIMRVGQNVHMIAAGTDRDLRQDRVGEACQWGVIEWAVARGCTRYDLEGIDPINNPSVYEFKKRLGGKEIMLCGHVHTPLTFAGRVISRLTWLRTGG